LCPNLKSYRRLLFCRVQYAAEFARSNRWMERHSQPKEFGLREDPGRRVSLGSPAVPPGSPLSATRPVVRVDDTHAPWHSLAVPVPDVDALDLTTKLALDCIDRRSFSCNSWLSTTGPGHQRPDIDPPTSNLWAEPRCGARGNKLRGMHFPGVWGEITAGSGRILVICGVSE